MQSWFDKECIITRGKTRSRIGKYRHSNEEADGLDYVNERREYHKLLRKKNEVINGKKRLIICQAS